MRRLLKVAVVVAVVAAACGDGGSVREPTVAPATAAATQPPPTAPSTPPTSTTKTPTTTPPPTTSIATTTTAPTTTTTTTTTTTAAPVDVVKAFTAAWATRDSDAMMDVVAEDAVFQIGADTNLSGHDEILAFFKPLMGDGAVGIDPTSVAATEDFVTLLFMPDPDGTGATPVPVEAMVSGGLIRSWSSADLTLKRTLVAANRMISIDGDPSDWGGIDRLDLTLTSTGDTKSASIQMAHGSGSMNDYVFVLLRIEDDRDWSESDPRSSASAAVMWQLDDDLSADVWRWRLECPEGRLSGGDAVGGVEGTGEDKACGLDDAYGPTFESASVDSGSRSENTLFAAWSYDQANGTWIFELCRRRRPGDPQDIQFKGPTDAMLAVAYWDPDTSPDGWTNDTYTSSLDAGWIEGTIGS